jgi:hypothetical protein
VLVLCEECHALADGERRAANATEAHLRRGLAALGKE